MPRQYDWSRKAAYAEAGFWLLALSFILPVVLALWAIFPDAFPFLPSRFWLIGIPTFLLSLMIWVPMLVYLASLAYPDR